MKKYKKEIIKLTASEVLLSIFDLALPFFEAHRLYRTSARKYRKEREYERSNFKDKISYLKKHGLITEFVEGKESYFELTPQGIKKAHSVKLDSAIPTPDAWDGKWRIVIFDIPEKHKDSRDLFRRKLLKWGFIEIQESVYVYPFDCTQEITQLSSLLFVSNNVLIMISEIIQGEEVIISKFLDAGILQNLDLKK